MSVQVVPAEVVGPCAEDDDTLHTVCHCTGNRFSACGLDMEGEPWADGDEDECVLCDLAWPDDAPTCPWGCDCEYECGPCT